MCDTALLNRSRQLTPSGTDLGEKVKITARWLGFGRTETGHVRKSNQDVFAAINSCNFWIVADGMGGHPAGDLAANIAVDVAVRKAKELVSVSKQVPTALAEHLSECVNEANRAIHQRVHQDSALKGMGSTVVAMTITPSPTPVAYIAHLGDSRAYRFHEGTLAQLTRDHTLVAMLVERGLINEDVARTYPDRHVLAKGLGLSLDMKPELTSTPLSNEDLLVLCSDGLTKMLEDADIASILSRADGDPRLACHELVDQALHRGGKDNVTVIVCAHTVPIKGWNQAIDKTTSSM
ncbi:PP2C family protein-serine/threonine phosphatase [Petrachloros mirabilis]